MVPGRGKSVWSPAAAERFLGRLYQFERFCCVAAFSLLAFILFIDILLRTLLGHGLSWSHQLGVYANVVVALLGIGLASAKGAHLRPRFADGWLPASWEPFLQRLQPLVSAIIYLIFSVLSCVLIVETWQLQERSTVLQTPVWPVQLFLPLAFLIAVLRQCLFALYPQLQPQPSELAE